MVKFYISLILKNLKKFLSISLIILVAQILYDQNKMNSIDLKKNIYGEYNELIKYDVDFYKYLQKINTSLDLEENIFSYHETFEQFIKNNLQNKFFKRMDDYRNVDSFYSLDAPLKFRIELSNQNEPLNNVDLLKLEKNINDLFILSYYEIATDTIFNLHPIPRIDYIKLKYRKTKELDLMNKLIYQILISIGLAFSIIIILKEFNLIKRKNSFWSKIFKIK